MVKSTLLAIDIGNSSVSTGIFEGKDLRDRLEIPTSPKGSIGNFRSEVERLLSRKEQGKPLNGVIISSVVPRLTDVLARAAKEISGREPMVVNSSVDTGLVLDVEKQEEVGTDRIADAVAAKEAFGSPVAVVDLGTASTITAVRDSRFIGGAILPGLGLAGEALHRGTAKLPQVDVFMTGEAGGSHVKALGKNTTASIISGIIYGTAGAVERILREIEAEEDCRFRTVLTGGYSGIMVRFIARECYLEPDLTLAGLRLIYERNRLCMS